MKFDWIAHGFGRFGAGSETLASDLRVHHRLPSSWPVCYDPSSFANAASRAGDPCVAFERAACASPLTGLRAHSMFRLNLVPLKAIERWCTV
jgi:hypothetical protein